MRHFQSLQALDRLDLAPEQVDRLKGRELDVLDLPHNVLAPGRVCMSPELPMSRYVHFHSVIATKAWCISELAVKSTLSGLGRGNPG